MFSSGLDGRTQVLDLSNNTASEYFYQTFSLNISCQAQTPGYSPGKRGVSTSRWSLFLHFLLCKKHALCYLCLFWRQWNAYCRASGSSTHFSSALVRLFSHNIGAIFTRIETQEDEYKIKLGQLKINCLPLLWDHIGPPWRPGQPHQPRRAGPFRQQTYPGRT